MLATEEIVEVAQELLSERFGGTQKLGDVVSLGGSGNAVVLRARVAVSPFLQQRSVVLKYTPPTGDRIDDAALIREVVSYQFTTSLPAEVRPGPVLLAHDIDRRILVITDSGDGETYADLLANAEGEKRLPLIRNLGRALGRMHAGTADREAGFDILLKRMLRTYPDTEELQYARERGLPASIDRGLELLESAGIDIPANVRHFASDAKRRLVSGRHRAFTPFDLSPDNIILADRIQFLDYEWAGFRDATFDIACVIAGFPQFLFTRPITDGEVDALTESWVEEVRRIWPNVTNEARLQARIVTAMVGWAMSSVCYLYYGSMNQVVSEYGERARVSADDIPGPEIEAAATAEVRDIDEGYDVLADALGDISDNSVLARDDLHETFIALAHYAERGQDPRFPDVHRFAAAVVERLDALNRG
ncbi:aminoglycoside phosphotransferase family protein [Corynebacterium sp. CCM 9185]|uniref:Phosphotransferase n=1 Tax=Corynebacterium marambiense TaxID=2765364 RepID=A0ABS0VUW2_9CORY|nr:phosphotransferase [Corynebacterium marambiense]MBI9000562.1 phosphotransferase [Corynebacterium marambiense]MCK7663175.1 aminoglycoside phosphotransferase family protein [Corynebacterium marambiense]MCX7542789.1 phosphotransferase [Corynebacterium marambiense]